MRIRFIRGKEFVAFETDVSEDTTREQLEELVAEFNKVTDNMRVEIVEATQQCCPVCKEFVTDGAKMHHHKYCLGE